MKYKELIYKVSFIITVHNDDKYLTRCLSSIFKQKVLPNEIIIIDDGSKNTNYKDKINNFRTHYNKIFFLKKKNKGPSSARNLGVKKSKYPFVCFIDIDDEVKPNYLKNKINTLKKTGNFKNYIGIFSNNLIKFKKKKIRTNYLEIDGKINPDLIGKYKKGISGRLIDYIFIKKNLLKIKLFDENLKVNEDFDLILRATKANLNFKSIKSYDAQINITNNSLTRNKFFEKTYLQELFFLNKAKNKNYFSKRELHSRYRYIELKMLRKLVTKKIVTKLILKHIFNYIKYF